MSDPVTISTKEAKHLASLDILRAIAALMVFAYHTQTEIFPNLSSFFYPSLGQGSSGLILFFVLSGYVITASLDRHISDSMSTVEFLKACSIFWIRRFFRIYPLYIFSIAIVLLFDSASRNGFSSGNMIAHITGLHALVRDYHGALNGVLWTLSLEIQYYVLAPFLYLILRRIGPSRFILSMFGLSVASYYFIRDVLIRHFQFWGGPDVWTYVIGINQITTVLIYFALGMAAYKWRKIAVPSWTVFATVAIFLVIPYFMPSGTPMNTSHFDVFASYYLKSLLYGACFFVMVQHAEHYKDFAKFLKPLFIWTGNLSYSLYIWHLMILRLVANNFTSASPLVKLTAGLMLAFVISDFTARYIEKPAISIGKKLISKLKTA